MSTTLASVPSTYQEGVDLVENTRSGDCGNNTWAQYQATPDGPTIQVVLHLTTVATIHADDSVTLRTGGWCTVTTKDRLNRVLGDRGSVRSVKGTWTYVRAPFRNVGPSSVENAGYFQPDVPFVEGLTVTATGLVVSG